jgi:uncharacterized phage protein (TIGR02220 family)
MEIIDFINDLRKAGNIYFKVWFPIIVQFQKKEVVVIKLNVPLDISKTTYYRVIHYGLFVFPNYVKEYTLVKSHAQLILTFNEIKSLEISQVETHIEQSKQSFVNEKLTQPETIVEKPKTPRKKSSETSYPNEVYEEIINYLNQATGKNYKTTSIINRKFITQRLNDGFVIDDFRQVITVKSTNWLNSKMEQFLRPETLFSNKFESYLNENVVSNAPNSNLKNTYEQISKATEYFNSQG